MYHTIHRVSVAAAAQTDLYYHQIILFLIVL